jgi:hypothetical protein
MADGLTCDVCGKPLLADEDLRYVARIEVYAAYDPMELTAEDLRADNRAEIERLVRLMHKRDPSELAAQVYEEFRFDMCPQCRKVYAEALRSGRPAPPAGTESEG